jgi:hypothetical protein
LPEYAETLAHAVARPSKAAGALKGVQKRVVVSWRIDMLSLQVRALAILADTSGLALPNGVEGIVGLQFLRCFRRWGSEQSLDGSWKFFLETDNK